MFGGIFSGCDAALRVTGGLETENTTEDVNCDISLWTTGSSHGETRKPVMLKKDKVGRIINMQWIIHGPEPKHWVEISCPNHELYRSPEILAPPNKFVNLGIVKIK